MRPGEKKMLRHLLDRETNSEDKLRLALFNLLDAHGVTSDDEAKERLKFTSTASAFSHLKRRLKDDLLSVFLIKESNKRIAQGNRAAQFECLKKLTQAYVLLFRGAKEESSLILENVRILTVRYELVAERIQMLHLLRENFIGVGSSSSFLKLNEEIARDMEAYQALLQVEEKSVLLSSAEHAKSVHNAEKLDDWWERVEELRAYYEKHKLSRIGFWYYMAATEFHTARRDFTTVLELGLDFLKLVENSPAIRSKNNIAGVNQTVGSAQMELRQFSQAIKHLAVSEKLFPAAGFNRLQCLQFLVLAEIANDDLNAALTTIDKALSHPRIAAREHLLPQWLFIKASVQFLLGDASAAFKTLNQNGYLLKQQDEWNIQFRLLEMMLLIEQRDEEWLEFKLDATRKFLTRHKSLDSFRVRTAIDVMGNLSRKGLNFEQISEKNLELLKLSLSEAQGCEWNPVGFEIARLDLWIRNKLPNYKWE